jgi:hypothetical protein
MMHFYIKSRQKVPFCRTVHRGQEELVLADDLRRVLLNPHLLQKGHVSCLSTFPVLVPSMS